MRTFIDVDVQECLQRIVDVNTLYYKSDFEYDIQALKDAAINQLNKNFLWLSRESGTYISHHLKTMIYKTCSVK